MSSSDLVAPFQGERYAAVDQLSRLIAPPYDVIDAAERAHLAALDEHNIVHVMLPEAPDGRPPDTRYAMAAGLLAGWRNGGVRQRDPAPALYVLAQDFTRPTGERRTRCGVFAAVKAEGYEPRRIRPHEKTHAGPKADRLALLRATATNIESIFLLAPDRDRALANAIAAVTQGNPTQERSSMAFASDSGLLATLPPSPFPRPLSTSPTGITATRRRAPTRRKIRRPIACSP